MLASIYLRMAGPSPNWKLKPSLFVCQTVNTLLTFEGPYNWNQPPQFVLCSYVSCGLICLQQWMYLLHSGLPVSDSLLFKIRFLVRLLQFTPVRCFLHYGFHEVPWLYQFLHCSLQVWKYSLISVIDFVKPFSAKLLVVGFAAMGIILVPIMPPPSGTSAELVKLTDSVNSSLYRASKPIKLF